MFHVPSYTAKVPIKGGAWYLLPSVAIHGSKNPPLMSVNAGVGRHVDGHSRLSYKMKSRWTQIEDWPGASSWKVVCTINRDQHILIYCTRWELDFDANVTQHSAFNTDDAVVFGIVLLGPTSNNKEHPS
jgi:hypothetical protein